MAGGSGLTKKVREAVVTEVYPVGSGSLKGMPNSLRRADSRDQDRKQ